MLANRRRIRCRCWSRSLCPQHLRRTLERRRELRQPCACQILDHCQACLATQYAHMRLDTRPMTTLWSCPIPNEEDEDMATGGVALSQVQQLIRENAALREERDRLIQLLAALGHADDEGAFALTWHPAKGVRYPVARHSTQQ